MLYCLDFLTFCFFCIFIIFVFYYRRLLFLSLILSPYIVWILDDHSPDWIYIVLFFIYLFIYLLESPTTLSFVQPNNLFSPSHSTTSFFHLIRPSKILFISSTRSLKFYFSPPRSPKSIYFSPPHSTSTRPSYFPFRKAVQNPASLLFAQCEILLFLHKYHLYPSSPQYFHSTFPHMDNQSSEGFIFLATCLHPKSRGRIRLVSDDPRHPPSIDPNYLHHPYDLACMRDGEDAGVLSNFWWWCVYPHMCTRTLTNIIPTVVTYIKNREVLTTKLISFFTFEWGHLSSNCIVLLPRS